MQGFMKDFDANFFKIIGILAVIVAHPLLLRSGT